jgi:hypothetical protein
VTTRSYEITSAERVDDFVGSAAGETMEQHRLATQPNRQTGITISMGGASAHGIVALPFATKLSDNALSVAREGIRIAPVHWTSSHLPLNTGTKNNLVNQRKITKSL